MATLPEIGFDQEAWDWIVADAKAKLAFARGIRPKRSRALVKRITETRIRNLAKRKKERMRYMEQISRENFHANHAAWRARGYARLHILAAMEPGHWYARSDISVASGIHRKTVNGTTERMERNGLLTRTENTEYRPMSVQERLAKPDAIEPRWLWTLTESGLDAREKALRELERLGLRKDTSE